MNRHLVPVKVGVVGNTNQRVNLDGTSLHQHRFKSLDPQAMQRGSAVQQHRVILDHLFKNIPDLGTDFLHHALGALDVMNQLVIDQPLHHKGLEQLQGHLLGQAALVEFQVRADNDHRAARIIDPLTQEILAKAALFAFKHIAQGLQGAIPRTGHRPASPAVVDKRINGFLEHSLLVADNNIGSPQVEKPLQAIVAVNYPAVEIIQIRCGKTAPVQLDHGSQVGRDYRNNIEDHP